MHLEGQGLAGASEACPLLLNSQVPESGAGEGQAGGGVPLERGTARGTLEAAGPDPV